MNIKKFNIGLDERSGKIRFDLEVDGVRCHGNVDVRSLEDLTDLLFAIEDGCQRLRRKLGTKEAEEGVMLSSGVKSTKVPVVPGKIYRNRGGDSFICDRITTEGIWFVNALTGWRGLAHDVTVYEDGSIEWDYSDCGYFGNKRGI